MPNSRADSVHHLLRPDWPAPPVVHAVVTLRSGGASRGPYGGPGGDADGWNLAAHCGDDPGVVALNRERLRRLLPDDPVWLEQVHGSAVFDADPERPHGAIAPVADAAVTAVRGRVLAVLTADCLPVLLTRADGRAVGLAHAGWRGLAAGVVERTVERLRAKGGDTGRCALGGDAGAGEKGGDARVLAWLGPAIGPQRFEVGDDVRRAFVADDAEAQLAFVALPQAGKWLADLYRLARLRLARCGVHAVSGGGLCTVSDPARFYSYRRDRTTGRMASLIWID